jgi:hypothetical protein
MSKFLLVAITAISVFFYTCADGIGGTSVDKADTIESSNAMNGKQLRNVRITKNDTSASDLCQILNQLEHMPKIGMPGDEVYEEFIARGDEVVPCLVEKIDDVNPMKDPRDAPVISDFKVGDAALFLTHRITNIPIQDALPFDLRDRWKDEGIYVYFEYVQMPENRTKIKKWWKERLAKK